MRFMVMGAGALGAYFGARLAAAGAEVDFIARGAHLEAMQARGLRIESPLGDIMLPRVAAYGDPAEAGPPDVVLFMVKNYDVEAAAERLAPVLGPGAMVVTAQNGISAHRRLAAVIGPERVVPGMVYMPAAIAAPGVVRHSSSFHRLVAGPLMDGRVAPVEAMAHVLRGAGLTVDLVERPEVALWEKFSLLAPLAALTGTTRLDIGPIRACPETAVLLKGAIEETVAVGRAVCPGFGEGVVEKVWTFMAQMPPGSHASLLDDLNRGRRIEVDYLSGEIVRLGRQAGIPTPIHDFAAALLAPLREGVPH